MIVMFHKLGFFLFALGLGSAALANAERLAGRGDVMGLLPT